MTHTELAILKLKKEDEILRLEIEVLELEAQMTGKMNTNKLKKIKKTRGEKCYERVMLEKQLIHEQQFGEENIA